MPELASCCCDRMRDSDHDCLCHALATQEDLLCDECRSGCNTGILGERHFRHPWIENMRIGLMMRYGTRVS